MTTYKKLTWGAFEFLLNDFGMTPVKNVPGVNEDENDITWWINKKGEIIHLVKYLENDPLYAVAVNIMHVSPDKYKKDGYIRVCLEGTKLLHRVLAATFLDMDYCSKLDVHHIDFDRHHNVVANLKVVPHGEHMRIHKAHRDAK